MKIIKLNKLNRISKYFLYTLLAFVLTSCEIFAVIDTNQQIKVIQQKSDNQYRVEYTYNGSKYFMEIITDQPLEVGDLLEITKK